MAPKSNRKRQLRRGRKRNNLTQSSREQLPDLLLFPDSKVGQMSLQRVFDLVLSAAALLWLLPLLLLVGAMIKLTSAGPVFFAQRRVGPQGRVFQMFKFRSMVLNPVELKRPLEGQNDLRITSIGRFIRKYSIDELPQLVNVMRGDMSLKHLYAPWVSQQRVEDVKAMEKTRRTVDYSEALSRIAQGFDFVQLLVPKRLADEEIGDALELINRLVREGRPTWQIYAKAASTAFYVLLNWLREVTSSLLGKKSKA